MNSLNRKKYVPVGRFEQKTSYCPRQAVPRGGPLYLAWRILEWLFVALGMTVIVSGCSTSIPAEKRTGKTFEIVQSNFLGSLWNESHARASVVSQDGGQSFAVPGGAMWAFGDTFKGSRSADGVPHFAGGAVSCSIAFLGENARSDPPAFNYLVSSNGDVVSPFAYFPDEPAERYRIWPLGGIHVNGQCYLFYSLIEIFGKGEWDFRGVGSGLGRSTTALGPYERLRPHGDWRFPVAASQVLEADGWIYLYEIKDAKGKQGVALARVRPEKIEDPAAYEFYAGAGPKFSSRKEAATFLVKNVPGQVSVAWNPYLEKYVMASSS
ncbi:MAG: DUF4185 domain-containing protein [Verrucomicrobiota bacterium]|jgi:hypothetical protein